MTAFAARVAKYSGVRLAYLRTIYNQTTRYVHHGFIASPTQSMVLNPVFKEENITGMMDTSLVESQSSL